MNTLIGRTFSYRHNGREIIRKVLRHFTRGTKRIYELLDPVAHTHHEAIADVFDAMFKTTRSEVKGKGFKGEKMGGRKQLQNI